MPQQHRWRVDVYYSGYTSVYVDAQRTDDALERGRHEAENRLKRAQILDPDGAMAHLVQSLEPWEECDVAELLPDEMVPPKSATKVYVSESLPGHQVRCSQCGQEFFQHGGDRFDFCPGCGAEFSDYADVSDNERS